ncbi:hypothetical protein AVEN_55688-1 [Araneus ventricosus]|uniref:Uncharacterized protein n=1 Tax=Araneus ventricosus TaxID=182803 RepID=A0A4Y2IYJ6_ARAVE|nr:hypothetical protein AVEN_55688-1 [Araneus ventricosus]
MCQRGPVPTGHPRQLGPDAAAAHLPGGGQAFTPSDITLPDKRVAKEKKIRFLFFLGRIAGEGESVRSFGARVVASEVKLSGVVMVVLGKWNSWLIRG